MCALELHLVAPIRRPISTNMFGDPYMVVCDRPDAAEVAGLAVMNRYRAETTFPEHQFGMRRTAHTGAETARTPGLRLGHGDRSFRLATYNIRKAVGLDWRRDAARTVQVINEIEADIVVIQEADRRLGDRPSVLSKALLEAETDFYAAPVADNEVSIGWHGNAVLLRRGVQPEMVERITLPSLEPRGAVAVAVSAGGHSITVVGVHLALLRRWRRRQLEAIRDHLGETRLGHAIIAGDFNEWSAHKGLEALSDDLAVLSPGKTFHASLPRAGLDRIAHGKLIESTAAGVHESPKALVSSDHLPIWADLKLRAAP